MGILVESGREGESTHPQMGELVAALEINLPRVEDKLINKISANGRKDFLGNVGLSNTRYLYKYLAAATDEGRWEGGADEMSPLIADSRYRSGSWEAREAIATHFAAQLSVRGQKKDEGNGIGEEEDVRLYSPSEIVPWSIQRRYSAMRLTRQSRSWQLRKRRGRMGYLIALQTVAGAGDA